MNLAQLVLSGSTHCSALKGNKEEKRGYAYIDTNGAVRDLFGSCARYLADWAFIYASFTLKSGAVHGTGVGVFNTERFSPCGLCNRL